MRGKIVHMGNILNYAAKKSKPLLIAGFQRNENFYFKVIAVKMRAYISSSRENNLEKLADYF